MIIIPKLSYCGSLLKRDWDPQILLTSSLTSLNILLIREISLIW